MICYISLIVFFRKISTRIHSKEKPRLYKPLRFQPFYMDPKSWTQNFWFTTLRLTLGFIFYKELNPHLSIDLYCYEILTDDYEKEATLNFFNEEITKLSSIER